MKKLLKKKSFKKEVDAILSDPLSDETLKDLDVFNVLWSKIKPYLDWLPKEYPDLKNRYKSIIVGFRGKDSKNNIHRDSLI